MSSSPVGAITGVGAGRAQSEMAGLIGPSFTQLCVARQGAPGGVSA